MEEIKECIICGCTKTHELTKSFDVKQSRELFTIFQCDNCGFIFTSPRPSMNEIVGYYGSHYDSYQPALPALLKNVPPNGKRFLDIGCGSGTNLVAKRNLGYEAFGIEIDDKVVMEARRHGLDVRKAQLDKIDFEDRFFDEIKLNHVLEHIHDLNAILLEIKRCLRSQGSITLEVPNIGSYDYLLYGRHWRHLDLPRHLYHFDQLSLRALLQKYNYGNIKITSIHAPAFKGLVYLKGLYTTAKSIYFSENKPWLLRLMYAVYITGGGFVCHLMHDKTKPDGAFLFVTATKD